MTALPPPPRKCKIIGCNNPVAVTNTKCGMCNMKEWDANRQRQEWEREENAPPVAGLLTLGFLSAIIVFLIFLFMNWIGGR